MALGEAVIEVTADMQGFQKDVEKGAANSLKDVGGKMRQTGTTLTKAVTAPVLGLGLGVLKTAGDFESAMQNISAITGATGGDLQSLEDQAKTLGATTSFSASEAAEGMTFLGMAGFDTEQIMAAMPDTLALASATATDLGTTADIVSNILTGFGLEAEEAGRLSDVMAKAASSANTDVAGLGEAMKFVAPVASGLGFSLEETTATIGALSDAGIQGSQAGTSLRSIMSTLAAPVEKSSEALKSLGIQTKNASGDLLPMEQIIKNIGESGATTADLMTIFGVEAGPAMQALVSQGSGAIAELTGELENAGGTAQKMSETQMQGLNGSLAILKSSLEGLAIAIADSGLIEFVTQAVEKFTAWVSNLAQTNPALLRVGVIIAGAAAALGPLIIGLGLLTQAFGMLWPVLKIGVTVFRALGIAMTLNPIGLLITAIGLLVAAFIWAWNNIDGFKEFFIVSWQLIKKVFTTVIKAVTKFFTGFVDTLVGLWEATGKFLELGVKSIKQFFVNGFRDLVLSVSKRLVSMRNTVSDVINRAKSIVKTGVNAIKNFFTNGFSNASRAVGRLLGNIRGKIGDVMGRIRTAVSNGISRVIDFFRNLPSRILSAIGNVGSMLYQAGRNIVQGLINGFTSMISSLTSTVSGAVSRVRDYLPFSPAKVGPLSGAGNPENSGEKIMEMLADGIETGSRTAQEAMGAAVSPFQVASRGTPGILGASASPTSTGSQVTNRNVNAPVKITQNFMGPTTSGGRLREIDWTLRYATQSRTETVEGATL